jgi:hypothetical protein
MGPGTFYIHMGLPNGPIFLSFFHQLQALVHIFNEHLVQTLNVDSVLLILVNVHFFLFRLFEIIFQQIQHRLIVQLQKGTVNFYVLLPCCYQRVKYVVDCTGNQATVVLILLN